MSRKIKYLDKKYLNLINHISRDVIKYNRSLPQEVVDDLPEDMFFPIMFTLLHEHIAGEQVEPHMRCIVGVPGRFKQLILDMEMGLFNLLPEHEIPDDPEPSGAVSSDDQSDNRRES